MEFFKDRADAGLQLAAQLICYKEQKNTLILALPRGGVPVAYRLAKELKLPMTIFLVRKLGIPGREEVAMGAIAEENVLILNQTLIKQLHITELQIQPILNKEQQELQRRIEHYRQGKALPELNNKTIILVDDGVATGTTLKAAIQALKALQAKKIILAAPVASKQSLKELAKLADEITCLNTPEPFNGVGLWYENFEQVSDEEVLALLKEKSGNFIT